MLRARQVPLRFGNIDDILLARRGWLFMVCAEKAELQRRLANLRVEYDPEIKKMIVPGEYQGTYRALRAVLEDLEREFMVASAVVRTIEKERDFLTTTG